MPPWPLRNFQAVSNTPQYCPAGIPVNTILPSGPLTKSATLVPVAGFSTATSRPTISSPGSSQESPSWSWMNLTVNLPAAALDVSAGAAGASTGAAGASTGAAGASVVGSAGSVG